MSRSFYLKLSMMASLALSVTLANADVFFNDNFTTTSTLNASPTTNKSTTATAYQTAVGLTGTSSSIGANRLHLAFPSTMSVLGEFIGLFTNSPAVLSTPGDYVSISVVFVGTNILAGGSSAGASVNIGLFNASSGNPNVGEITLNTGNTTGGSQNWVGYASRAFFSGNSTIFTRTAQTASGTTSQNQDLLFTGASSSQAFNNPSGTSLGSTAGTLTLTNGYTNTLHFVITLSAPGSFTISNAVYGGVGTATTPLFSQVKIATNTTFLTSGFNGFAFGWRNVSAAAQASSMTVSSVKVEGSITPPLGPPTITTQPVSVSVATNGACAFSVVAAGSGLTYQWRRNGTNLLDGGNISGATSSQLIVSSASPADVFSGANGYYVVVTGAGNLSTNSTTNSLTLVPQKNLVWAGAGSVWDLNSSANWLDPVNPATFNYGDAVTFNDVGSANTAVTLTGSFLSASSVIVDGTTVYNFSGSGAIAGPANVLLKGSGFVSLNVANTHTGGVTVSNAAAYVNVLNYAALGTGPLRLSKAGGQIEVTPTGSSTVGIAGNVIAEDDFTILFAGSGTFAGVIFGNLSGTANKTLTLSPKSPFPSGPVRYRVYGTNTVMNANLAIVGNTTDQAQYGGTVLAPYNNSGTQTYNGVISGDGGLIQRAGGTTILNASNTYAGGTTPTSGQIGLGHNSALGTGPLNLAPENGGTTGSGTIFASGGARTIANTVQYPSGTNNSTLIIGGTNALTFSGPFSLNGVDNITNAGFMQRTIQVNNTAATTISSGITDNALAYGLIKTGTGPLYLNGNNTFTGASTNSAGLLAGNGTLASPLFIQTNSTLGAGSASSLGTFTLNGGLNLRGNGFFRLNKSLAPSNDLVAVTGSLTNSGTGTITVTNLGPALADGDTFKLFSQPVSGGAALTIAGGGVNWTNKLAVDGTIQVLPSVATYATNLSYSVSGSTLSLSWPATHLGWRLQVQTNTLTTGLNPASNAWSTVSGSTAVTQTNLTINPANGAVFFRLVYP